MNGTGNVKKRQNSAKPHQNKNSNLQNNLNKPQQSSMDTLFFGNTSIVSESSYTTNILKISFCRHWITFFEASPCNISRKVIAICKIRVVDTFY